MKKVLMGMVLTAMAGCGDSSSQGGGPQGGGAQGGNGAGASDPGGCVSIDTLGQASTYAVDLFHYGYVTDLDDDGDDDLVLIRDYYSTDFTGRFTIQHAINEGSSLAIQAVTELPYASLVFMHPRLPNVVVAMHETGDTAFINAIDLSEVRAQCPEHDFILSDYRPSRPIDIDGDGLADVFVNDGSIINVLSVSDDDPCGWTAYPTDLAYLPGTQTSSDYGSNEVWSSRFPGIVRLSEGQGLSAGTVVATTVSADVALPGSPAFGDVDGDGEVELVGYEQSDLVVVEIAQASWSKTSFQTDGGLRQGSVQLADLDCDGDLDAWDSQGPWINRGDGDFVAGPLVTDLFAIADVTGDGTPDFISRDTGGDLVVTEGVPVPGN